jgi:hypothetical protein
VQRLAILLKNFDIDDSSYICLIHACPILVEYGSDSLRLNVTSALLSHSLLSLTYFHHRNGSIVCTIQTRFAVFSSARSLTCTDRIYLHPRYANQLSAAWSLHDCRAHAFEQAIYRSSVQFHQRHVLSEDSVTTMRSSADQPCHYTVDRTSSLRYQSLLHLDHLLTTVTLLSRHNPWRDEVVTLGPCRTSLLPFTEMVFTDDIVSVRNVHVEQKQTIQVHCEYSVAVQLSISVLFDRPDQRFGPVPEVHMVLPTLPIEVSDIEQSNDYTDEHDAANARHVLKRSEELFTRLSPRQANTCVWETMVTRS